MTRTIFNSDLADFDETKEYLAQELQCDIEEVEDEQVWNELYLQQEFWYDAEKSNLNKELGNNIIAFGTVGVWNGTFNGYKVLGTNLNDILSFNGCDDIEVVQKGRRVFWTGHHHDGSHHMELRLVRDNVNIDNFLDKIYNNEEITSSTLNYYTRALGSEIDKVYGKQMIKK